MNRTNYGKLVRLKTKQIIESRGSQPKFLNDDSTAKYAEKYFKQKLLEEVIELNNAVAIDDC